MNEATSVDAVVVGAGFSGLYQLHALRELGLSVRVLEAGSGVGGTWYWNRYPGARCDVESMSYSFSFSPELEQEWTWTEKYPGQPELARYLNHVADRFDLRRDITFDTRVVAATYDEAAERWRVTTEHGDEIDARFLIMATGCLSVPKVPEIPGLERFQGDVYSTATWPSEPVDFSGKRVAVIGTGSSGLQAIPEIAKQAAELTVYQRTPSFAVPAFNRPLTEEEIAERKAGYRAWRAAQRDSNFGLPTEVPTQSALEVSEEERRARYDAGWAVGATNGLISAYTDLLLDREANETASEYVREKIRERVSDPELAEKLSPRSYGLCTRRICLETNYFETYNEPHVHLVDLLSTPLVGATEAGLETTDGERPFDAIVLATGFDAMTGALTAIDIRGRDGVLLRDKWADGPRNLLGLAVAGFPNLFTITGPLSPSTLSNMSVALELHVEWIRDAIAYLDEHGLATMEATPEGEDAWVETTHAIASATLFPETDSWYTGTNIPGKPRVFMVYVGGLDLYGREIARVAAEGYPGFRTARPAGTEVASAAR